MTVKQQMERYRAALKDMAQYCPYTEGRKTAVQALDLSQPLVLSKPVRLTGKQPCTK